MRNSKKQKIIVAKTAGFCMGVKRAVDMIMEVLDKKERPVYTYGQLIHNPQVIEFLNKKGVTIIDNNRIPENGTVVIRAHGISPKVQEQLKNVAVSMCDATCPYVIKVQRITKDYAKRGYTIIIIGDKGHAEVESYLGYASGRGIVIEKLDELDINNTGSSLRLVFPVLFSPENKGGLDLPRREQICRGKYCVVAQTTQDKKVFCEIVSALKGKIGIKLEVYNTICNATSQRQEESIKLAKRVNAMVVVGGKNSANTLRLALKCRDTGTPTYFIERAGELDLKEVSKYDTIGVTAGASTPQEVIQEVVDYIQCKI